MINQIQKQKQPGKTVWAIAAQTQKLDTLKTHKKGLMQRLFPAAQAVTE
jgi:hypothetical protein